MRPHEVYVCVDCDEVFKAVGTNIRCPRCMSSAFIPVSIFLRGVDNEREVGLKIPGACQTCVHMV